ncbi:MAG: hypothetical protein LBR58_10130 [Propionibacteriaceae bacterium]|jgi:hypothetical protein|nr:hypothetical protein [Propionibacteriaceae bacterium]
MGDISADMQQLQTDCEGSMEDLQADIDRILQGTYKVCFVSKLILQGGERSAVQEDWGTTKSKVQEIWDRIVDIIQYVLGNDDTIAAAAATWRKDVGRPCRNLGADGSVEALNLVSMNINDHWEGRAADTFKQALSNQGTTLVSMADTIAGPVADALDEHASAIRNFHLDLLLAVTELIGNALANGLSALGSIAPTIAVGTDTSVKVDTSKIVSAVAAMVEDATTFVGNGLEAIGTFEDTTDLIKGKFDEVYMRIPNGWPYWGVSVEGK